MEKKLLKTLLIIFLILIVLMISLIGYRASLVYKIYKARDKVLLSENIKVESIYNVGQYQKTVTYRKGNCFRVNTYVAVNDDSFTDVQSSDFVYDCDNGIQIDVGAKQFYLQSEIMNFAISRYQYPVFKMYYNDNYEITFKDKMTEFSIPLRMILKGYPHIINKDGKELISIQNGGYIMYFDKETGLFLEMYELRKDKTTQLMQKNDIKFDEVTEEDMDYGDINEFYFFVSE